MVRVPQRHHSMVFKRILDACPSAVSGPFFFIQRWYFTNIFDWVDTGDTWSEQSVPCNDYPLSWVRSSLPRPLIVAWRQKLDGVPYARVGPVWKGDEEVILPSELSFIQYFERIGNDCYVLFPYTRDSRFRGGYKVGDLTFFNHEWRRDSIYTDGEGVILLMSDRKEYRVKCVPTTEVLVGGLVMEVQLDYDFSSVPCPYLSPIAPRAAKKPQSEVQALTYLAQQVSFGMENWKIEADFSMMSRDLSTVQVRGKGDNVTLSVEGLSEVGYANVARVPTSAKILIQDSYGNFLLIKEGSKPWDLPGGKADNLDERPSDIIRREVIEELDTLLPKFDWKKIRVTEHSIAFLFHVVVDRTYREETDTIKWFSVGDYERLPLSDTVAWLPDLFREILGPGPVKMLFQSDLPCNLLTLAKPGDLCYGKTEQVGLDFFDAAGNRVIDGRYVTSVIPVTVKDFDFKTKIHTTMLPVDPTREKVDQRARDQFAVLNNEPFVSLAVNVGRFLVRRFQYSFVYRYAMSPRTVAYWGHHSSDHQLYWFDGRSDIYGVTSSYHFGCFPKSIRSKIKKTVLLPAFKAVKALFIYFSAKDYWIYDLSVC